MEDKTIDMNEVVNQLINGVSKKEICQNMNISSKTLNMKLYDWYHAPSMDELRNAVKEKKIL